MHRMLTKFHANYFWLFSTSHGLQYPFSVRRNFDLQAMQTWLQVSYWCLFGHPKLHSQHWARFVLHLMCQLLLAIDF